jgi:hypothetical protein
MQSVRLALQCPCEASNNCPLAWCKSPCEGSAVLHQDAASQYLCQSPVKAGMCLAGFAVRQYRADFKCTGCLPRLPFHSNQCTSFTARVASPSSATTAAGLIFCRADECTTAPDLCECLHYLSSTLHPLPSSKPVMPSVSIKFGRPTRNCCTILLTSSHAQVNRNRECQRHQYQSSKYVH